MLNTKLLLKSIRFMFLPTLAVFALIFFYFLNFNKFIDFVASQDKFSSWLRVFLLIVEVVLVIYMYGEYLKEEVCIDAASEKARREIIEKDMLMNPQNHEGFEKKDIYHSKEIKDLFEDGYYKERHRYTLLTNTSNPNIVILKFEKNAKAH